MESPRLRHPHRHIGWRVLRGDRSCFPEKDACVYFSRKNITHTGSFTRKSRLLLRKKIAGEKFSGRIFLQKEEERTKEEEKCDYLSKQPMIFRGEGSGLGTALICKDDAFRTVADKLSERRRTMLIYLT